MTDKHPRESVSGVFLMIEIEADFLTMADLDWLFSYAPSQDLDKFWVGLEGTKEEFFKDIGAMAKLGCSQTLISHLKYARDKGAKWILIKNRGKQ